MLPKIDFKVREGDIGEDGGCTFDKGSWMNLIGDTTDLIA